jgi:AAA ATPase domain
VLYAAKGIAGDRCVLRGRLDAACRLAFPGVLVALDGAVVPGWLPGSGGVAKIMSGMSGGSALGRLVSRGPELAALRSALERARAGRASVVLVACEAGVGKSRVVAAVAAEARADGVFGVDRALRGAKPRRAARQPASASINTAELRRNESPRSPRRNGGS